MTLLSNVIYYRCPEGDRKGEKKMMYYEVYEVNGLWEIWKVTNCGSCYTRFKAYKTRKGAENWARKQWYEVIWR